MIDWFFSLLFTIMAAFGIGLFVVLFTGSLLFAWIAASLTGVFMGVTTAKDQRDKREKRNG